MIVLDASIVVELIRNGALADRIRTELAIAQEEIAVPHLLDVEVANALRGLAAGQRIDAHDARRMLANLAQLPAERYPHTPLMERVWELRHNFTADDAVYLALAEITDSALFTCDEKLTTGHRAQIRLFVNGA